MRVAEDHPGIVSIFTGPSPETSLVAMGQMLRLGGRNLNVLGIWFLKAPDHFGEQWGLEHLKPYVDVFPMFPPLNYNIYPTPEEVQEKLARGMKLARESWLSREYDLIVLDEILTCCADGRIAWEELVELLSSRPDYMHVTMTGIGFDERLEPFAHTLIRFTPARHHLDTEEPLKGYDR